MSTTSAGLLFGSGTGGTRLGTIEREHAERDHPGHQDDLEREQPVDAARHRHTGDGGEDEDRAADRQRRRAGQRDHPVHADEHTRAREPVDEKQRRHDRERRADEHRARIAAAPPGDAERDARCGGDGCAQADHPEVRGARE